MDKPALGSRVGRRRRRVLVGLAAFAVLFGVFACLAWQRISNDPNRRLALFFRQRGWLIENADPSYSAAWIDDIRLRLSLKPATNAMFSGKADSTTLSRLCEFEQLRAINLYFEGYQGGELAEAFGGRDAQSDSWRRLRSLSMSGVAEGSADGFHPLSRLKSLSRLSIMYSTLPTGAFDAMQLGPLTELSLRHVQPTEDLFALFPRRLAGSLERLTLDFCSLDEAALDAIAQCSNLKSLSVTGSDFDPDYFVWLVLPGLPKLERLFVVNTSVGDEVAIWASTAKSLEGLYSQGSNMSQDERRRLSKKIKVN